MAGQYRNIDNPGGKRRILDVELLRETDTDPDISHLGEYARHEERGAVCIDRAARGDCGPGEMPWFICAMSGEESGNPESPDQDYQRAEAFNRGDWWMIGIHAVAKVVGASGVVQGLRSGGLWGIESDSDAHYLDSVGRDELADLRAILVEHGFSQRAISAAFKGAGCSDKAPRRKAVQRG